MLFSHIFRNDFRNPKVILSFYIILPPRDFIFITTLNKCNIQFIGHLYDACIEALKSGEAHSWDAVLQRHLWEQTSQGREVMQKKRKEEGTSWSERWQCECCKHDKSATGRASNAVASPQAPITLSTTAVLVLAGLTEGRPWRAVGHFSVEVSGSVAPLEPQRSQLQALRTGCFPELQPLWLGGQV